MATSEKRILIVDDSEIDREILKTILTEDFEIFEASDGRTAIENIVELEIEYDAIMLDLSMPVLTGFDVLRLLKDKGVHDLPIFLITSEATHENVIRAAEFGIAEFICKPFDREEILRRMHSQLGMSRTYWLTVSDIEETNLYIDRLERIYKTYLANLERSDAHYKNMVALARIIFTHLSSRGKSLREWTSEQIDIASKAAYFCDIGYMQVPDRLSVISRDPEKIKAITQNHTRFGSELMKLRDTKPCEFFVDVASDMCLTHHERVDGRGYPRNISGKNFSIYGQVCKIVDDFDSMFSKLYGANDLQINLVMKKILQDDGSVSGEVLSAVEDCKLSISDYYAKSNAKRGG